MTEDFSTKSPQEVLELVEGLEKEHHQRAVHLSRLKLWAQVGLQGLSPDQVRAFSKRESDIRDSYQRWLKGQKKLTPSVMQMGRATFGMKGSTTGEDPAWVRSVQKDRHGRYSGDVYTVAILMDGSEVRLDPPVTAPLG